MYLNQVKHTDLLNFYLKLNSKLHLLHLDPILKLLSYKYADLYLCISENSL